MAKGKINIEIGSLCGIGWRMGQKHIEYIYEKPGVKTRNAAAIALEKLNEIVQ